MQIERIYEDISPDYVHNGVYLEMLKTNILKPQSNTLKRVWYRKKKIIVFLCLTILMLAVLVGLSLIVFHNFRDNIANKQNNLKTIKDTLNGTDAISSAPKLAWTNTKNGNKMAHGCDFLGKDLRTFYLDADNCSSKCEQTCDCTHYAYHHNKSLVGTCYLLEGKIDEESAGITNNESDRCGIVKPLSCSSDEYEKIQWNDENDRYSWANGCDFNTKYFKKEKHQSGECGDICYENCECTNFTWTMLDGGTCWLSVGSVNKESAVLKTDTKELCGVIKESSRKCHGSMVRQSMVNSKERGKSRTSKMPNQYAKKI